MTVPCRSLAVEIPLTMRDLFLSGLRNQAGRINSFQFARKLEMFFDRKQPHETGAEAAPDTDFRFRVIPANLMSGKSGIRV